MKMLRVVSVVAVMLVAAAVAPQLSKRASAAHNNQTTAVAGPFILLPQQTARLSIFNECTGPWGLRLSFRDATTGQVRSVTDLILPSAKGITYDAGSGADTLNLIGVIQTVSASSCTSTPGTLQVITLSAGHPVAVAAVLPAMPVDWELTP